MDKFFLSPVPEFEDPVALDHFSEVFEAVANLLTQPQYSLSSFSPASIELHFFYPVILEAFLPRFVFWKSSVLELWKSHLVGLQCTSHQQPSLQYLGINEG